MTTPRKNPTIGRILCWTPGCGQWCAVRRNARRQLYMVCLDCGNHTPHGETAQAAMLEQAEIWSEQGAAPADAPRWIAEDWEFRRVLRDPRGAREIPGEESPAPPEAPPREQPEGNPEAPRGVRPVPPPPEDPPAADPPDEPPPEASEPAAADTGDQAEDELEEEGDNWP